MNEQALNEIAQRIARRYARACWWVDRDDAAQEGVLAMLTALARGTYDPAVGVPLEAYMERVAVLAIKHYVLRQSAPVSCLGHDNADELKGLYRAPLDLRAPLVQPDTDMALHRARVRNELRERVQRLLGEVGAEAVWPVLADEENSADVASRVGLPVKQVYLLTARARQAIRTDPELWRLWKAEVWSL